MDNYLRTFLTYLQALGKPDPAQQQRVAQAAQPDVEPGLQGSVLAGPRDTGARPRFPQGAPAPWLSHDQPPGIQGSALAGPPDMGNVPRAIPEPQFVPNESRSDYMNRQVASGHAPSSGMRSLQDDSVGNALAGGIAGGVVSGAMSGPAAAAKPTAREVVDPLLSRILNSPQTERYITEKLLRQHVARTAGRAAAKAAAEFEEKTGVKGIAQGLQDVEATPDPKVLRALLDAKTPSFAPGQAPHPAGLSERGVVDEQLKMIADFLAKQGKK